MEKLRLFSNHLDFLLKNLRRATVAKLSLINREKKRQKLVEKYKSKRLSLQKTINDIEKDITTNNLYFVEKLSKDWFILYRDK